MPDNPTERLVDCACGLLVIPLTAGELAHLGSVGFGTLIQVFAFEYGPAVDKRGVWHTHDHHRPCSFVRKVQAF